MFNLVAILYNRYHRIEKADIVEEQKKQQHNSSNNDFLERIKNVEDEHTLLLKLQKQYENGEVLEKDLSQEQIKALCDLYDTQIEQLKASNEQRKQKILEYMNSTSNA